MDRKGIFLFFLLFVSSVTICCIYRSELQLQLRPTFDFEDPVEDRLPESMENWNRSMKRRKDPVRARLAESMENWDRSMKRRKAFEDEGIFNPRRPWATGVYFWDLFYPAFDCPHTVERIGKIGDGGKWVCGLKHLSKNCNKSTAVIMYSFGVNGEVTFEEEILERTEFSVYMFDHTIDIVGNYGRLQKKYPGRVFLEKKGLCAENDMNELKTLSSIMKTNGHKFVDIIKMDIEWAEWKIIEGFKNMFPSGDLPFGQLLLEFHLPQGIYDDQQANINAVKLLETMHLLPFKMEFNLGGLMRAKRPLFCEYAFINTHVDNCLLHSQY